MNVYKVNLLHIVCDDVEEAIQMHKKELPNVKIEQAFKVAGNTLVKNTDHGLYKDYSYYVGQEVTCQRIPIKFSKWRELNEKFNKTSAG